MHTQLFIPSLTTSVGLLEECDLDVVTEELDGVSTKWHLLGEHLQVPMDELNSIRHVRDSSHENCLRKVLRFWLESYYTPTWSFIVLFLRVFNFDSQLTDHLEVKYCSSELKPTVFPPVPYCVAYQIECSRILIYLVYLAIQVDTFQ